MESYDLEHRVDAWELEIKCPNCSTWLHASSFLSTGECVSCGAEFQFKIKEVASADK